MAPRVVEGDVPLVWKPTPIPRFECEDDRFYAWIREEHDHWSVCVYEKVRRKDGALLITSDLVDEDQAQDEASAKAAAERIMASARKRKP